MLQKQFVNHSLYFVMAQLPVDEWEAATINYNDESLVQSPHWFLGNKLPFVIPKIVYTISAGNEGHMPPLIDYLHAPIMSLEMITVLKECGVDNIEVFDVVIKEEATGYQYHNYRLVNVIGLVNLRERSLKSMTTLNNNVGSMVKKLEVNEHDTDGKLIFRLEKHPERIFVHHTIKSALIAKQLPLLYFMDACYFKS